MDAEPSRTSHSTMVKPNKHTLMHVSPDKNNSDDNKILAGQAGAIEVIVSAIKAHTENARVCEHGCRSLCSITYSNGKNDINI